VVYLRPRPGTKGTGKKREKRQPRPGDLIDLARRRKAVPASTATRGGGNIGDDRRYKKNVIKGPRVKE